MSQHWSETSSANPPAAHTVLALIVNNHPGVMSHICGLFSRRAFNMDGILCLPLGNGQRSRIWLRVAEDGRLDQVLRQLEKLEDVLHVQKSGIDDQVVLQLREYFQ